MKARTDRADYDTAALLSCIPLQDIPHTKTALQAYCNFPRLPRFGSPHLFCQGQSERLIRWTKQLGDYPWWVQVPEMRSFTARWMRLKENLVENGPANIDDYFADLIN